MFTGAKADTMNNKNVIETALGDIHTKKEVNFLGIRFNNKLDFTPQIEHVTRCLEQQLGAVHSIINMGYRSQITKIAKSVLGGKFSYALGIMPPWTIAQYIKAQKHLNDAIKLILGISNGSEGSWPQRKFCRHLGWQPIHITHAKLALGTLNRILMNKEPKEIYDICCDHLRSGGKGFNEIRDNEQWILKHGVQLQHNSPSLRNEAVDFKMVRKVFPCSVSPWLRELPRHILMSLGKPIFKKKVNHFYMKKCYHRVDVSAKNCPDCKSNYKLDVPTWEHYKVKFDKILKDNETGNILCWETLNESDKQMWFDAHDWNSDMCVIDDKRGRNEEDFDMLQDYLAN